ERLPAACLDRSRHGPDRLRARAFADGQALRGTHESFVHSYVSPAEENRAVGRLLLWPVPILGWLRWRVRSLAGFRRAALARKGQFRGHTPRNGWSADGFRCGTLDFLCPRIHGADRGE